jgi:hypothetical protein
LAVGSNDQVLVADSAASTGLAWKSYGAQFVAGKNKIINGDFGIWQRGTSFNPSSVAWTFCADRFQVYNGFSSGTFNASRQTFTPGTAPVSGYEGSYFLRLTAATTGTSNVNLRQLIEDVRTLAGQSITFSFWAKASASTTVTLLFRQNFGTGGSATVDTSTTTSLNITSSWQRFTFTTSLPSISGKTIGTNSALEMWIYTDSNFTGGATFDTWGWQLEAGSVATPFTTATGTIQGELAACQRYYWRITSNSGDVYTLLGTGPSTGTTTVAGGFQNPVPLRTVASSVDFSTLQVNDGVTITAVTSVTLVASRSNFRISSTDCGTAGGLTSTRFYVIGANNTSTGFIGFSAEL